jgi:SagB-type dehydrogenase family enzyme
MNQLKVNPFLLLRFEDKLVVEDVLRRKVFGFASTELSRLFLHDGAMAPSGWADAVQAIASSPRAAATRFVTSLKKNNLLVDPAHSIPEKGIEHWIRRNWVDALLFHCRTNNQKYADETGDPKSKRRRMVRQLAEKGQSFEFWKDALGKRTALPAPSAKALAEMGPRELTETLKKRRTNEPFRHASVSKQVLSDVLGESTRDLLRIRRQVEPRLHERPELAFVSAYTAHEVNVIVFSVDEMASGVYHYDPRSHELVLVKKGDFRRKVSHAVIGQRQIERACFVVVLSAVWERYMKRYQHAKAYRNLLISTGSLAHYFLIAAVRNDLATFVTPALQSDRMNALLGIDESEEGSLYVVGLG